MTDQTDQLTWRKSTFSGANGGDCVELADSEVGVLVRNSKHPELGALPFTRSEIHAFIAGCKAGEFDNY
jgi:hypothetical protein